MSQSVHTPQPAPCWSDRLELGEGIRWVDGRIVLVDILTGRLLSAPEGDDRTGPLEVLAELPVPLGAVAPVEGRPGSWIAAAGTGFCLIGADGTAERLACPEEGRARGPMRMNDAAADPSGRLWAGSMSYDGAEGAGALYRMDRDGTVTRVLGDITVPNGPVFGPDGTTMFLADSVRRIIRKYPVDSDTGDLGEPSVFTTLDSGSPDGMAVDTEGGLWTAVWGTGRVHRYLPDGTVDRVVRVPAEQSAGICLGGADGRTLYITSARVGLPAPGPFDGAVFEVRVAVPGLPTAPYRPEWV
jgi:sugar lactone lactonase YvrE